MTKISLILLFLFVGCSSSHHFISVKNEPSYSLINAKEKVKKYFLSNTVVKPVIIEIEPGHYFLDKPI